jgi:membrane protease YdiL (CAAX protease family)
MAREKLIFTSRLSKAETVAALIYLPVHLFLLPMLFSYLMTQGTIDETMANFLLYAIGFAYMLILLHGFLRRDFDPLCDHPFRMAKEIFLALCIMYLCNIAVSLLLSLALGGGSDNLNNDAIMDMGAQDWGMTSAMAVFLAPIAEECMFRAGIFGTLRRHNRIGAYIVAVLAFSLYHVWGYAVYDPSYLLYAVQYIPVSILLCYVYERCNSIWGSIFFHMLVNYVSINALKALEALL